MPPVAECEAEYLSPAEGALEMAAIDVGGLAVHLARPANIEAAVDVAALLRGEQVPEPPYWMHLWPGSVSLAKQVANHPLPGRGQRLLELGCGLGLPALIAACRGASVIATDRLRAPLRALEVSALAMGVNVERIQMDWVTPALHTRVDCCLGADIAYDAASEPALVAALTALVRPRGQVWLADSVNTTRTTLLERLRGAGFALQVAQRRETEAGRPVWVRLIEARRR